MRRHVKLGMSAPRIAARIGTIAAVVFLAGQAQALRCAQPTLEAAFEWSHERSARKVVALGTLTHDPDFLSSVESGPTIMTQARFSGQILGPDGFEPSAGFDVAIYVSINGPWLGMPPTYDVQSIIFLDVEETGYALFAGPCGSDAFAPVTPDDIALIENLSKGDAQ